MVTLTETESAFYVLSPIKYTTGVKQSVNFIFNFVQWLNCHSKKQKAANMSKMYLKQSQKHTKQMIYLISKTFLVF